jgi:hypothetical protein
MFRDARATRACEPKNRPRGGFLFAGRARARMRHPAAASRAKPHRWLEVELNG